MTGNTKDRQRPDTSTEKLLLTTRELADLTGFAEGTLRHWVSQKKIPFIRMSSRCVRFRVIDIKAWLSEKVEPERYEAK